MNKVKNKILEYFLFNPTERLRKRGIERAASVPFPSVVRYVDELISEGLLREEEFGGVKMYSASRSSKYKLEKKLWNIRQLYESGLMDYLIDEYWNPLIILFGSYARGEDIERSDIDIFVETSRKVVLPARFSKKLRRELDIFREKKITNIKNKYLINSMLSGMTLNKEVSIYGEKLGRVQSKRTGNKIRTVKRKS